MLLSDRSVDSENHNWTRWILRPILGLGLAGGLLWLAVRDINLDAIWRILQDAHLGFIGMALFSVALNVWSKTVRWKILFGSERRKTGFFDLLAALMTGQTLNWFLPGRLGDLSRAYAVGRGGAGKSFSLGTVALEKVIDLAAYALLFIFLLILLPLPAWLSESGYTLIAVSFVMVAGVGVLAGFPERFDALLIKILDLMPASFQPAILVRIRAGLSSLSVLGRGPEMFQLSVLTALVWGSAIWTNDLTARALGLDLSWTVSLTVLIILQAGITVPLIPGRIGLFQYLCILGLGIFGMDETIGLSYGILLQAIVLIPTTLISLVFFARIGLPVGDTEANIGT